MTVHATMPRVPLADPHADLVPLRDKIIAALAHVIDAGAYVLGTQVAQLEQKLASRLGRPGAVGVGCGTDALALALLAVGVAPGDEVVRCPTPPALRWQRSA
jgi:dTDP-4-amino-4,6-dideoxygalactose transaminase